jgi:hypothetical protein
MSVAAAPPGWFSSRRNVALAALLAIALLLAIAIGVYNRGGFRAAGDGAVGDAARIALNQGAKAINALGDTVAGLFGSRSPGERAEGLLANMKHRKRAALHQRALPKVRGGPLARIVGAPPLLPVVPPVATPLYNAVTGTPKAALPGTPSGFTPTPSGPGIFPGFSPPGGGGVIVPPPVTISPPETPGTPATPTVPTAPSAPVPEPASWLMMLLGFMLIGRILRRDQSASLLPT